MVSMLTSNVVECGFERMTVRLMGFPLHDCEINGVSSTLQVTMMVRLMGFPLHDKLK
jgi:hypothetical protein